MFQVQKQNRVTYEDLMRELEVIEHQIMQEDRDLAMNLMVLEAKIRDRFNSMEKCLFDKFERMEVETEWPEEDPSMEEIRSMIPKDASIFPTLSDLKNSRKRKKTIQTIATAAILAFLTAGGVFGLASVIQLTIGWIF